MTGSATAITVLTFLTGFMVRVFNNLKVGLCRTADNYHFVEFSVVIFLQRNLRLNAGAWTLLILINNSLTNQGHMAKTTKETFSINGEQLLKKVKELVAEGNVTKITIKDKAGKELMSFPVTIGLVGVVLAPIFAAVGALAALVTECTIAVEREEKEDKK
jgi:hypothetical protein